MDVTPVLNTYGQDPTLFRQQFGLDPSTPIAYTSPQPTGVWGAGIPADYAGQPALRLNPSDNIYTQPRLGNPLFGGTQNVQVVTRNDPRPNNFNGSSQNGFNNYSFVFPQRPNTFTPYLSSYFNMVGQEFKRPAGEVPYNKTSYPQSFQSLSGADFFKSALAYSVQHDASGGLLSGTSISGSLFNFSGGFSSNSAVFR